ncbi:MAG: hypothetical protein M0Q48_00885 [Verrucomicrobia bacterium]|nr:hypothetical protein [Verrucomicrobiota bacterium]
MVKERFKKGFKKTIQDTAASKKSPNQRNEAQYLTQPEAFKRQRQTKTTSPEIGGNIKRASLVHTKSTMVNTMAKRADISKRSCQTFLGKPVAKHDIKAFIEAKPELLDTVSTSLTREAFRSISSNFAGSIFRVKIDAPTVIRTVEIRMRMNKKGKNGSILFLK